MTRVLEVLGHSAGGIAAHVAEVVRSLDGSEDLSIDVAGPADLPVAAALTAPNYYAITPEPDDQATFLASVERQLELGVRRLQLRAKRWPAENFGALARTLASESVEVRVIGVTGSVFS